MATKDKFVNEILGRACDVVVRLLVVVALGSMLAACVVAERKAGPNPTMTICHKGKKTLTLPEQAARSHLGHGDYVGACP